MDKKIQTDSKWIWSV